MRGEQTHSVFFCASKRSLALLVPRKSHFIGILERPIHRFIYSQATLTPPVTPPEVLFLLSAVTRKIKSLAFIAGVIRTGDPGDVRGSD